MRAIDADRLLTDRMKSKYYHLPNGDIAIPIIDIENAPTIEPEPHWIPCKERMPETDGKYLISVNLDGHEYCDEDYWHRDSWNMYYKKSITAWMPKIEPYREGAQE